MVPKIFTNIREFPMSQVANLDSYAVNALAKDVDYLISFDTDRLLAGFRETAGLNQRGAERYSGWESTLIGGHTIGHYLSAAAQAYVNKGVSEAHKTKIYEIIVALIDGLLECQVNSKGRPGFLFGAAIVNGANVEAQFDNVEKNLTNITSEAWVPWYTMHKILAGVIDTYKLTKYDNALEVARGLGDWAADRVSRWDAATAAQVIRIEYGGMNDVLYELFELTGDAKYATAAHVFDSVDLFENTLTGSRDVLNNHHANTTIPKFMGALNRYLRCHGKKIGGEVIDATRYLEYAEKFWDMVVERHTYVTGGNSEWEHFGRDGILDKERTNCNCETCNVYNMLKFSRTLFGITGDVKYLNYYENAYYNTILSSQNPETGMTTYFQPMSTGYFKVFGERFTKFWCCTGTGMENFTKLNDSIYFAADDTVIVNLYQSSELVWKERGLQLQMTANLQKTNVVEIRASAIADATEATEATKAAVKIALRIPDWLCGNPVIAVNGSAVDFETRNGFAFVDCGLFENTRICLTLPMKVNAYPLPDNSRSIAFKYGPTVLSGDLGTADMTTTTTGVMVTIPATKISGYDNLIVPKDVTPEEFISNPEKFLIKDGDEAFTLSTNGLRFAPHFKRYKERYGIYFTVHTDDELKAINEAREKALRDKPEGVTIDTVQPGYGQYENDELHQMSDWGGSVGSTDNGTSRYAKPGGFFTYRMCVDETRANYLSLTFLKEDNGKSIRVSSGDEVIYEDVLAYEGEDESYEIRVRIPEAAVSKRFEVEANGEKRWVIPITFRGSEGAGSARVFGFIYTIGVNELEHWN